MKKNQNKIRIKTLFILKVVIIFLIVFFFTKFTYYNWTKIVAYKWDFNFSLFIISIFIFTVSPILLGVFWHDILHKLGKVKFKLFYILYIQSIAWISRYIPGNISIAVIKTYFGKKNGIDTKTCIICTIYEMLLQIFSGLIASIPLIYYLAPESIKNSFSYKAGIIILIPIILLLLHPKIFHTASNLLLKIAKKQKIEKFKFLSFKEIFFFSLKYLSIQILNGFAFFIMINSITTINISHFTEIVSFLSFSGTIGMLAIFIPAGLGVREGILALLLTRFFPIEIGVFIAIASRSATIIGDGLLGIYATIYKIKNKNKSLSFQPPPKI
ncbi:MAG: lysylphosphatidylglycerol synthase domain-containing protein [Clostridia bacterium]|nr:lysylphosphatidylglycerol synthase domain-containing protein [Clostridia bacterium]